MKLTNRIYEVACRIKVGLIISSLLPLLVIADFFFELKLGGVTCILAFLTLFWIYISLPFTKHVDASGRLKIPTKEPENPSNGDIWFSSKKD